MSAPHVEAMYERVLELLCAPLPPAPGRPCGAQALAPMVPMTRSGRRSAGPAERRQPERSPPRARSGVR